MRRAVLLTALVWLCAFRAAQGQTVSATAGATYTVVADHDGMNADGFRFQDNGVVFWGGPQSPIDGTIKAFWLATPGAHTLTASAWNTSGEAMSAPLLVQVSDPAPPPLQPCPYVKPTGVSVPTPIGGIVQGENTYELSQLSGVQNIVARTEQLVRWGFHVEVYSLNGKRVGLKATCQGYRP